MKAKLITVLALLPPEMMSLLHFYPGTQPVLMSHLFQMGYRCPCFANYVSANCLH